MTSLASAVAKATATLAPVHLRSLAKAYCTCGEHSALAAAGVLRSVPAPHRGAVAEINLAWQEASSFTGAAIAFALEAALEARSAVRPVDIEVVVTGPVSSAAPVRLTSQVVRQLIDQATSRVMLISFSAYAVADVLEALDRAIQRDVQVQLVLESAAFLQGGGGAAVYEKYDVFEWPPEERDPLDAKLHAKAVIVDSNSVLLTSANLSNAAFRKNIELGVLCRGGETANQAQQHFDALIMSGVLKRA